MKNKISGTIWEKLNKYKYVLIVVLVGVVLLLIPTRGASSTRASPSPQAGDNEKFSLEDQENKIAEALSQIDGAGKVSVVLTLKSGTEQVYATNVSMSGSSSGQGDSAETKNESSTTTVIVSAGSSDESPVKQKVLYPVYLGALVVAEGGDNAEVRLQLISAVSSLTGLGTDKVTVTKMKIS